MIVETVQVPQDGDGAQSVREMYASHLMRKTFGPADEVMHRLKTSTGRFEVRSSELLHACAFDPRDSSSVCGDYCRSGDLFSSSINA